MSDDRTSVPREFIPDDPVILARQERCGGCGDLVPPPSIPYEKTKHRGEVWHLWCAFEDRDDVEKVTDARFCRNCHGISKWHPLDDPEDVRLCVTCGMAFRGPVDNVGRGPPYDPTDEVGDRV